MEARDHIAIFASGNGSNAERIIRHFQQKPTRIRQRYAFSVLSNRKDAPVLAKATALGAETFAFGKEDLYDSENVLNYLARRSPKLIVLAGFLWLVPQRLLEAFPGRIVNIHPSLLPKYGGKGMYGKKVHEAVIAAGETETGITVHFIDEQYDRGETLFQAKCPVLPGDTPDSLAQRVHELEHAHFPQIIDSLLK